MKPLRRVLLPFVLALAAISAPAADIPVAFSPDAGARELVIDTLRSARSSIRLAAYVLTDPRVVQELVDAHEQRGVDVQVVVDSGATLTDPHGGQRAALQRLVAAQIPTRVLSAYRIAHDKFVVIDGRDVQTGSYNYTVEAARHNSENVVLIRDRPDVAARFLAHWSDRFAKARPYVAQ